MKLGMKKWMIVPALLAAVGCANAHTQQQTETQPETSVTLRSTDGKVRLEIVDDKGETLQIVSKTITLLGFDGVTKGELLLDPFGAFIVETAPEPKPRVRIGLTTETIPEPLALHLALEPLTGLMVTGVTEGLAAQKAGLVQYDLLVRLDDQSPVTQDSLRDRVERCQPGETITLTIVRQGNEQKLEIVAEEYVENMIANYGTYNYKPLRLDVPPYKVLLAESYGNYVSDAIVLDVTPQLVQPELIEFEAHVVSDARRIYVESVLADLVVDRQVVTHLGAIVTTDDCPIAALRAELRTMVKQIAAMEALLDRLEKARD